MTHLGFLISHRFMKFGVVGAAGTGVNLLMLYLNQEYLFLFIRQQEIRLGLSLAVAICLATLHNYLWNRKWTWQDRLRRTKHGFFVQMGQYFMACGLSILLQFCFTLLLSQWFHYIPANIMAICMAALINYLINDRWTFSASKKLEHVK